MSVNQSDAPRLAFWMANSSELLHFLKSDRHITSFSLQAQEILAETVHLAFRQLVLCLQGDLAQAMPQVLQPNDGDDIGAMMQVSVCCRGLSDAKFLRLFLLQSVCSSRVGRCYL